MLKGAKVLVAGGAGFIGTNLILRLLAEGCRVRAVVHERPLAIKDGSIQCVCGDLTRMDDCRLAVEGMDYVFMCAANTSGAAVITATPLVHVTPNVVMNAQMLDAAYSAKVKKFLFISSGAAYPPTGSRPVREDEMFSGDPYEAYYPVAWMKRYTEILCRTYAEKIKNPMPVFVVRPSNIYGPYDKFNFGTSHMAAALMRRVVERHRPLEVWGTGEDVRDLIYVDDFIEGLLRAFHAPARYLEVNIASGQAYSVKQVLQTILDVDGFRDADVRFDPSKPSTIPVRLFDTARAETVLGFRPKTDLAEGIRKTLQWYRATHR